MYYCSCIKPAQRRHLVDPYRCRNCTCDAYFLRNAMCQPTPTSNAPTHYESKKVLCRSRSALSAQSNNTICNRHLRKSPGLCFWLPKLARRKAIAPCPVSRSETPLQSKDSLSEGHSGCLKSEPFFQDTSAEENKEREGSATDANLTAPRGVGRGCWNTFDLGEVHPSFLLLLLLLLLLFPTIYIFYIPRT